ncbi:MAG: XRE family transcriptional regulator [Candidatus Omnitrophota bacterium]|jgi:quercetin dioxygenase-like cupin family protein
MHVGVLIKKIRKERDMTLVELAKKSGVALATLSRVENGRMTGTLESHMSICKAFDITLPELYKYLPSSKKAVEVLEKAAKHEVFVHDKRSSSEILVSNVQKKKMMPMLIKIAKGGQSAPEKTKSGVERFVYVLEGKVEAAIGDNNYNLSKGDTLYFESSVPHNFKNTGSAEAQVLALTSPPGL